MRFGLSLPMQYPEGDNLGQRFAELLDHCIEQIERHRARLGIQEMGFRVHWPGMPHRRALDAIALLGERVLPRFA